MILVKILILFFILLIIYQVFLAIFGDIVEGMDTNNGSSFQPYNTSDPNNVMILTQQNSGNISYLNDQVTSLNKTINELNKTVLDISGNIVQLQTQVNGLVEQQAEAVSQITTNGEPVDISGT